MFFLFLTTILLITLFIYTFFRMVKSNSIDYIYVLVMEFVGILIDFVEILLSRRPSIFAYTIIYLVSVGIPILIMVLEKKDIYLSELKLILFSDKYADNKEKILAVIEKRPKSYLAHKKLVEYYEKNEEKEKAEDEYFKLIEIRPDEYNNYCKLAKVLCENNKQEQATALLQQLLETKPDYSEASIMLGSILYDSEKFKEAILVFNQALKYNPKEYDLYYYLGMTYTRLNDFNNAKECYSKAATINSLKDIANLSIGQIYLIFEDYDKAEEYFYKTLESDDDALLANSYYYLAKIKLIQGNQEQAVQYANMAIECDPAIIKKIQQDEIFVIILSKIKFNAKDKINTKMTEKDIRTIEHLGKTFNVVERLTNNYPKNEQNKEQEIDKL